MPSNIDAFLKETNAEIKKLQEKQVKEAKRIVLYAYDKIDEFSPVDTGLFRHNNIVTVNTKTKETVKGGNTRIKNPITINTASYKHNDTITIQNNLKYADALEAGHSQQAPSGVYGVAEELTRKLVNKRTKIQ